MSPPLNEGLGAAHQRFPSRPSSWSGHERPGDFLKPTKDWGEISVADSEDDVMEDASFAALGVGDILALDTRPTFVVKISTLADGDDYVDIVFANRALKSTSKLWKAVQRSSEPIPTLQTSATTFRKWLEDVGNKAVHRSATMIYGGFSWNAFIVEKTFLVVGGSRCILPEGVPEKTSPTLSASSLPNSTSSVEEANSPSPPRLRISASPTNSFVGSTDETAGTPSFVTSGTPDWTLIHPQGDLPSHIIFTRSIDWSKTPLGDMNTWSREFRQVANLLMANPHPAALFWGEELTVLYNKAYADTVAGDKHPNLMGIGFTTAGAFQELWDFVGPIFKECRRTGKSVAVSEQNLPMQRYGFLQETFYTWSLTPLYGGTSEILGLYNAPFETTRHARAARATKTLLNLAEETASAQKVAEFWQKILKGIDDNGYDFPFALVYSVSDDIESNDDMSNSSAGSMDMKTCVLEGSLGVPRGHLAAPDRLDLRWARGGFTPSFRDSMRTREPKLLNLLDGSLSESLVEGIEWRGYGEPCRAAIVCPIRPTTGENIMGFLVFGINPRRKYDDDYQDFVRLLDRQLATSLASVTLFEAEIQRGVAAAHAAAVERSRLSKELERERTRMQRLAEFSAVGMFSIDINGAILEANDRWYEMTGNSRDHIGMMSWMDTIHESSLPTVKAGWAKVTVGKQKWSAELRIRKRWFDPISGEEIDNWVLATLAVELSADEQFVSVMGSLTDIALQKQNEKDAGTRARLSEQLLAREQEAKDLQAAQLAEAVENRRRQNNFIDITSHEMRNPLSAILQCADSISTSLKDAFKDNPNLDASLTDIIHGAIESAETVQLCAQHQKSIVDDILTVSKLDSNLLLITPMPVQPVEVVGLTLTMFNTEIQMSSIDLKFVVDNSWIELQASTVMLDSSRLRQVFVNLMTNAIKFTKTEVRDRNITISLSAHPEPPTHGQNPQGFKYFPTEKGRNDVTVGENWGKGTILYLRFEVRDSGCGLTEEEKKNLFTRYVQASPKTHVKYGGSGLGLFISRQLTELQGGEIGVASEAGVGSTFAFYVKARRAVGKDAESLRDVVNAGPQLLNLPFKPATSRVSSAPASLPTLNSSEKKHPNKWHVLIVEDNLVNQRVLAKGIRKLGCTVHVANHGGEAIELLQETKYFKGREHDGKELTVILMDLEMPIMDGLTCVRKIRGLEKDGFILNHLPIIAVTANARNEQVLAAKESGMDDVMPKPFQIRDLVPKIEALLPNQRPH